MSGRYFDRARRTGRALVRRQLELPHLFVGPIGGNTAVPNAGGAYGPRGPDTDMFQNFDALVVPSQLGLPRSL